MFSAWLFRWSSWWRRPRGADLEHLHFLLYARPGCHLCEVAWRQLQAAQRRHRFSLKEVDVDAEPELAARYGSLVPVVAVNGKVRFRGAINEVLLDRLLRAENLKSAKAMRN